jgi:hypothetical protein
MTKRSSLFSIANDTTRPPETTALASPPSTPQQVEAAEPGGRKYPIAKTREGKRVATVYLEKEALRQLQKLAFDEETTLQALLVEGINNVFAARGLSRIA